MEFIDQMIDSVSKITGNDEISKRIVRQLTKDFGGEQVYIPLESSAFKADIESSIYDDFLHAALSVKAIGKKYGFPSRAIYKIIEKKRKERRKNMANAQLLLFD